MRVWESNIRKVVPYVPGEQPKGDRLIKLNTNENPYPPAPGVAEALKHMDIDRFRKYPDPTASDLVHALAEYYGVGDDQIFVGVGSDDVIAMSFLTFFNSEKPVLFPDVSYSFYKVWADLFAIPYETPALDANFCIRPEDYYRENGGVIFPNPNAPTGILLSLEAVEDMICHNQDVVVIVDEAYIDFGGKSALELIKKYENLLVVQTFSKSRSMAGARLGYAIGDAALIQDLEAIRFSSNPYNVNRLTLRAGAAALAEQDYYDANCAAIVDTRADTKRRLEALGFTCTDSRANFLFARHPAADGGDLYRRLKERGVLVRRFDAPRIGDYIRITIGTRAQMDALLERLEGLL